MKFTSISSLGLAILAGVSLATPAFSEVNIEYVTVGNAGNAADTVTAEDFSGLFFGAVPYEYRIGKYEVTNAQYAKFLNAVDPIGANADGIYNTNMGSDARGGITYTSEAASGEKYTIRTNMGDKPVNFVSWYDAARFTNWLHNGQGSGSTETGAYTLSGNTGIITKNVSATAWLPSEDQWYKAAYYNGDTATYSLYPTQSDTAPTVAAANATGDITNPGSNVANYDDGADWNSQNGNVTTVGSAGADSFYGTFDQGGNVWEWNDNVHFTWRGLRGGSWENGDFDLSSPWRAGGDPSSENSYQGFRVASAVSSPDIAVSQTGPLADGSSSVAFGAVAAGDSGAPLTFTITNPSAAGLAGLVVTKAPGTDAADFTVSALSGTTIPVGSGTVTFYVTFTPSNPGSKSATLQIASNVVGAKNPFTITLTGTGDTVKALYDAATAGLSETDSLPDAIPFNDGVKNILKYAFNMNLGGANNSTLVSDSGHSGLPTYALDNSGPETVVRVQYIRRTGSGLIYTPLKSGNLETEVFEPIDGAETSEAIGGGFERVTVVAPCDPATEPTCFWRVRVTLP